MSDNFNSKYILKLIAIIIIVIINIIALIGVVITVSGTVKKLKKDISTGKITKEIKTSENSIESREEIPSEDYGMEDDFDLDVKSIFKVAISDKNVRKSLILMVFALLLLAGAIFILVKVV